jgi:hypothetical protein
VGGKSFGVKVLSIERESAIGPVEDGGWNVAGGTRRVKRGELNAGDRFYVSISHQHQGHHREMCRILCE